MTTVYSGSEFDDSIEFTNEISEDISLSFELFESLFPNGLNREEVSHLIQINTSTISNWKKMPAVFPNHHSHKKRSETTYTHIEIYRMMFLSLSIKLDPTRLMTSEEIKDIFTDYTYLTGQGIFPLEYYSDYKKEALRLIKSYFARRFRENESNPLE